MTRAPETIQYRGLAKAGGPGTHHDCVADPAIELLIRWRRAQHVSKVLCRLQQRLERRVLDAANAEAMEHSVDYSIAYQAEVEAATATLKIQDQLPATPARSLLGIVANLEVIAGADHEIDDPTDFPWPHIASVLDDLKQIAGSVPRARLDPAAVHSDCARYRATAAELVGLENRAAECAVGQNVSIGIE